MNAQFVYTKGPYHEFRGYVFANGKPACIRDRATLEALSTHPDFRRIDEEVKRKETAEEVLNAQKREVLHVPAKRGWPLGKARK